MRLPGSRCHPLPSAESSPRHCRCITDTSTHHGFTHSHSANHATSVSHAQPCPASQPRCSQPHQPLFWRDCARQARAPADWVAISIQSDAHDLNFKCGGTLTDTFWLVGEFCTRVGGGVLTVREGIEFGTKAMTAHENTADHTSSAANGPFIAYMVGLVLLAGCMLKVLVGKYVHRYM